MFSKRLIQTMFQTTLLIGLLFAAGCTAADPTPDTTLQPNNPTTRPANTVTPAAPTLFPASPTITVTQIPPTSTPELVLERCSPLEGVAMDELPERISNPFLPPRAGSDDPHQGVDFADLDATTRISLEGRPVQAVFPGLVAAVIQDRFPYGSAVIIETRLSDLPASWTEALDLPAPVTVLENHPVLTCPTAEAPPAWDASQRSLYLIYAHLQSSPEVQPGEQVHCGQRLGTIGMSGNALNPHLHLEARVGPAGASFPGMAHYTADASPEELRSYCQWRVSGAFQLLDPMLLLASLP